MIADGTILNTVKTYVEQVGRKRTIQHWNELDSLECIWNGPTAQAESWIPAIGTLHPSYPSMRADRIEVLDEAAEVTEIRVTYVGKYHGGLEITSSYGVSWGESSYVQFAAQNTYTTPGDIQDDGSQGPPTFTYEFISYNWAVRYQLELITYKTLRRDNGPVGAAGGGLLSRYDYRTGRMSQSTGMGLINSTISFPVVLLDHSANSLNNGWYELSETWGPRATIDSQVFDIQTIEVVTTLG